MKQLAVMGESTFTLGFRLAGITNMINSSQINDVLESKEIGIVIMHNKTFDSFDEQTQEDISTSISPVFVVLSETTNQAQLRKMIMQSIGVDLLKEN